MKTCPKCGHCAAADEDKLAKKLALDFEDEDEDDQGVFRDENFAAFKP